MMPEIHEEQVPFYERHPRRPAPIFVDRVMEHVAKTGHPETFAGMHPGPIASDEIFEILREVIVPLLKREDGRRAPCPMCQPNKFADGRLVWFSRLQAI